MITPLYYLACLSIIDEKRDELEEEFGDLPDKVAMAQKKVDEIKDMIKETQAIIAEVKQFSKDSKVTIQELKTKEEKLSKQQFLVRNNKEFDAVTKEIEHSRTEFLRLSDEIRNISTKEENLIKTLELQKFDLKESERSYKELKDELELISKDQSDEVKELIQLREDFVTNIPKIELDEYNRIRMFHKDAVVRIRKNSCSGCYSHVPPQKIVEIRNNLEKLYTCEHCGRILYPEEVEIDKSILSL